jgi:type I restriction enzyme S subunit
LFFDVPAIIFGDHTRIFKYVEKPCFLGADGVKLLKAKKPNANHKYLYYALCNADIPNTGYNRHFKWLKEVDIPEYSEEEQEDIVLKLDKISHLIALRRRQLSKLDELVKSRFVEMFGDGEVLGVRSQGLGSRGDKWPMVKIEEVGFITSGGTPSRARPEYYNGEIRWYSAGELNSLYLPDSVEHITEKALQESSAKLFKKGSLLIGMYDTAAFKMGILTEDASSNQACANLTPYEDYNVVWLYYLFEKMKPIFLKERQGVRQKNLSLSKIKNFQIPIVPLSLQREFAAFVEKVDKLEFKAKASLEKLETLKKAMMQKYFN